MLPIAVDAMGGDHAPEAIVKGVAIFLSRHSDVPVVLFGDKERISPLLETEGLKDHSALSLRHADEVIEMHEKLATARRKTGSSMMLAVEAVKGGEASALVSLGNTMATVALTHLKWGLIEGVDRAGIGVPIPSLRNCTIVIDMGANLSAKPQHLRDYAIMASLYAEKILERQSPRVGLLNVGEESGKGGQFLREAYALLEEAPVNFTGNAEGRDIFTGEFDVVVCDGFVGNAVLKAAEGAVGLLLKFVRDSLTATVVRKAGAWLCRKAFDEVRHKTDYAAYGGAPLLGVSGICIIGHGRSNAKATANALKVAREAVLADLPGLMTQSFSVQGNPEDGGGAGSPAPGSDDSDARTSEKEKQVG